METNGDTSITLTMIDSDEGDWGYGDGWHREVDG